MIDIPQYNTFVKIEPLNKGWSRDKKYYIETTNNEKLLLRISDISEFNKKKSEYEAVKAVSKLGINMTMPIDFGVCDKGSLVYMLLTWVDGEDAEIKLPTLSKKKQYELGLESGRILSKIHTIPADIKIQPWSERFNQKIDRNIANYLKCGIKITNDDKIIEFINQNRYLLKNREQTFQHGDFLVGNLVINSDDKIGVFDFNRYDFGDPWDEFNRIVWSVHISKDFANGQIHGYFQENIPNDFFILMGLYIASNALSSIPWAIPFGEDEVNTMIRNIDEILDYYDNFNSYIPTWYVDKY